MWLAPITQLLTLAAAGAATVAPEPAADQAGPKPIATRQTEFALPFTLAEADRPDRQPAEVRLSVSGDRGRTWHPHSKVEPTRRQFVFQAYNDGEYWFRLQTLDRSGQLRPKQPGPPGLVVIVDTVPPKLEIEAQRGDAGQITAKWTVYEPHPDLDRLTIQYRTSEAGPWQQVAVSRDKPAGGAAHAGVVSWWPAADSGKLQIRAEVADTAGNPAVSHAIVNLAGDVAPQTGRTAVRQPLGPWRASTPQQAPDRPAANRQTDASLTGGRPNHYDPTQHYGGPTAAASPYPSTSLPPLGHGQATGSPPPGPIANNVHPPIGTQYAPPGGQNATNGKNEIDGQSEAPLGGPAASAQRPRMVNSRLVELSYDDRSLSPAGFSRVELWGTINGGQTWRSFALDNDNRSPLVVPVDGEGIYGFRVVVQGGAASAGPPTSGELPDVWIGVDLTKPTARINAVNRGIGPESGRLVICWQADDWMLAARPVTLLLGNSPGGPWTTLAAGLENTGRYVWAIDGRTPAEVYLRLEVADEAGNVGTYETTQPVSLAGFRPAVQIQDARPLGQSSRTPAGRYYR